MKGFISKAKDKASEINRALSTKRDVLSVDSATESQDMKDATKHVEQTYACLTQSKRQYDKFQKSTQQAIHDHRAASDGLSQFGVMMKNEHEFAVMGEFVDKVVQFSTSVADINATLNQDLATKLLTPLDGVIEGDLAEAEFSKKRFNKVLSDYDAANKRIQQMQTKGGANPQKLQEALKEQEQLQAKYDTVGQQTMQTLTDVNNRVEFAMFQTLLQYVDTYAQFFQRGAALMESVGADLAKYRLYSEKKREAIESGASVDSVRLEDIAGNEASAEPRDGLERAVLELVEKERAYVRKLDIVSKTYIQNIRVDDNLNSKFTDDVHRVVFCNVEEILALHKSLVADLEADLSNYPHYSTGQLMLQYLPRFKMYNGYIRNYSQAINALDQVELRSHAVRKFMRTMDRKSGLRGLLGEPTGRIPAFVSPLQNILDNTPGAAMDADALAEALDELRKLVTELQDSQRVSTNISTMLGVYNELSGCPGPLLDPARVLRREASLNVHSVTPDGKAVHELNKFYLCNDVLILAKKKGVLAQIAKGKGGKANEEDAARKYAFVKQLVLDGASVDVMPDNEEAGMLNAFEVKTNSGNVVASTATAQERTDWVNLLNAMIEGTVTNAVFEVPLQVVMSNQRDQSIDLPEVVVVCTDYVLERALDIEGIFRMSGSKREIAGIIAKFNRGEVVHLENETTDEHTVTGVLKHWVRMLPEPLLTYHLLDDFLAALDDTERLRDCVSSLPNLSLRVVSLLFYMLHQVAIRADVNKMDSKNLAIVFAPGLLRREGASDFDTSHYENAYIVIGAMIDNYEELFEGLTPIDGRIVQRNTFHVPSASPRGPRTPPLQQQLLLQQQQDAALSRASIAMGSRQPLPGMGRGDGLTRSRKPSADEMAPPRIPQPQAPPSGTPAPTTKGGLRKTSPKTPTNIGVSRPVPPSHQAPAVEAPSRPSRRPSDLDSSGGGDGELPPDVPAPTPGSAGGGGGGGFAQQPPSANTSGNIVSSATGSARPPCARCGEPIRGAGLKALNAAWHKDCFVCAHCGQPFAGKILQKDGKPYCEADFRALFGAGQAKICHACNEKINGPFMKALDAFWHADHFLCHTCGGSVSDGYYEKDGWPYCQRCYE